MADIDIRKPHSLSRDEAKKRVEQLMNNMKEFGIDWRWEGDRIKFDANRGVAKGMSGTASVDASQVRVEAELPFLLMAAKGLIEKKFEEQLDVVFKT